MTSAWRDRLLSHGASLGRTTYAHDGGIGVEFGDGCDVFWALPGEVTSTVPVPPGGPATETELVEAYDRIDGVRGQAIHALRHYIASKSVRVQRSPDGSWPLEFDGGMSTSLSVGAYLTSVAAQTGDVYETVRRPLAGMFALRPPSKMRIDRYLRTPGPPPNERPLAEGGPKAIVIPQTIRAALAWMGLCKSLDNPEALTTREGIVAAVQPKGPIAEALLRFGDLLPDRAFTTDLAKPGSLNVDFDDGDDHFSVDVKSRALARQIRQLGPAAVGDRLAAEFRALNDARAAFFRAVRQAATDRGWRQENLGFACFGGDSWLNLGVTHREIRFRPDKALSDALRTSAPEQVLRWVFSEQSPEFADACVAALRAPRPDVPRQLPTATLQPKDVPPQPQLVELDDASVAELDAFARSALAKHLSGERTIWDYRNPDVWDPKTDTWATPQDWVALAERCLEGAWPHPAAILILLDAGDSRAPALVTAYLDRAEPHHEVSDADVEIVWRHRHQRPDVAAKWFAPQVHQDVPFAAERAKLGDPLARRNESARFGQLAVEPGELPPLQMLADLPQQQRLAIHGELLTWARTSHRWAPPDTEQLRAAARMGWSDVARAMEENPYLLPGLLTHTRRPDQFDEPGLLLATDFLLVWSKLWASRFLARLIATARRADLLASATAASQEAARQKPEVARNVPSSIDIYRSWLEELQPALAVAWSRCRRRL